MEQFAAGWQVGERELYEGKKYCKHAHAVELVERYGMDSLAYLTLEKDKEYFFGTKVEGFIAYVLIDNMAVCMGNPVCASDTMEQLFTEFFNFSRINEYKVCFCSISKEFLAFLNRYRFKLLKYGEEALLDLELYDMKGSSTSKLRQKLKRADKAGIKVLEYTPQIQRDYNLEQKIVGISEEWLANKNGKLGFTLGELNLDNPLARRYFVAMDEDHNLQAVLMFSPFASGEGYFLDVMRRSMNSIPGVMEKSIVDAAMKMKNEGIKWVSLGLAPLAGIKQDDRKCTILEKTMNFVYENVNHCYDFKALHHYKKKFAPTHWEPRYIAYESRLSPIKVAYVMIKARRAENFWKQLIMGLWEARKAFIN